MSRRIWHCLRKWHRCSVPRVSESEFEKGSL
nr:MAG TPA: hypothetical protein [Caudoviricetes sp.]